MNEPVEDGIGVSRVANEGVPFVDGDLTGEDGRATPIAFLEDLGGAAIHALREALQASEDERLRLIVSNFVVPAARVRAG